MRYFPVAILVLLALIMMPAVVAIAQVEDSSVELAPAASSQVPPISRAIPDIQPNGTHFPTVPHVRRTHIREVFQIRQTRSKVQRFEGLNGVAPFILDKSGAMALFRYERGGEVMVLKPVHTTRGDTLYKNDQGVVVLRLRRVGGATVFPKPRSRGIVAWSTGAAQKLGPPKLSLERMTSLLGRIADDLANQLDRDISISVNGANEDSAWIFLDAASNVRIAIKRSLRSGLKAPKLKNLARIEVYPADQPTSTLQAGVLKLAVTPKLGYQGRLSSYQIQNSLWTDQPLFSADGLPIIDDQWTIIDEAPPSMEQLASDVEVSLPITEQ